MYADILLIVNLQRKICAWNGIKIIYVIKKIYGENCIASTNNVTYTAYIYIIIFFLIVCVDIISSLRVS